uniref:Uncharacterized protein n=1 Tax=Acrobeloides nanus TaxID=290746 RepID=A0A914CIL7_9BILA
MWEQISALIFNQFDHSFFDMWLSDVMMEDNVVLLTRSFGLDSCMEAVKLGQVNVAVDCMHFFALFFLLFEAFKPSSDLSFTNCSFAKQLDHEKLLQLYVLSRSDRA